MLYSIFKANIRQPIGGDFAFSPKLAKYWTEMEWGNNTRQYGIDIFMTTSALLNGFKVCQVALGSKVHKPSAPKLGPMFTQVITTLFTHISNTKNEWMNGMIKKNVLYMVNLIMKTHKASPLTIKVLKRKVLKVFPKKTLYSHP